ncbi:DUF222 domain-containing protein [Nocardia uniformis]|uniref:DUF222 domain-containing protein n=1 Tax=Nocardia uniformis TaxID=53432 RepID=A0A849BZE4_9NOCA|nr:HNH endonuclease signature motif containing protein [Nocardia uniformis]NNH71882.1 DUF222 domain-containing protein [Nocardia uniformis]
MSDSAELDLTSYELVERLEAVHARVAVGQAEEVALMTRLYRMRRAQQIELGVAARYAGESTATEIGVNLHVSQRHADGLIALGLGLEQRLPLTRAAFARGRVDLTRVRAIHDTLVNAPDELVEALEERIVEYAARNDPARLRRAIRKWLLEIDPAGAVRRRKEAEQERYVSVQAADNGTALLDGVLPAAGGWALYERLREMAITDCCGADPRSMNQRRADALIALADGSGRLTCQCERGNCPRTGSPDPANSARRALVQVGVSAETLIGIQDNPGLLAGFGAIDANLARQIARHARFQFVPENDHAASGFGMSVASAVTTFSGGSHRAISHVECASAQTTSAVGSLSGAAHVECVAAVMTSVVGPRPAGLDAGSASGSPDVSDSSASVDARCAAVVAAAAGGRLLGVSRSGSAAAVTTSGAGSLSTTSQPGNAAVSARLGSSDITGDGGAGPTPSAVDAAELRYRPALSLAARVRAIDGICRAPGCRTPAIATDLDHQSPFDHHDPASGGPTTAANLGCLCRRHHRLKTLADHGRNGWSVIHHPDRRVEWRTPTGTSVTTSPEGAKFLFPHNPIPPAAEVPDPELAEPLLNPGRIVNALAELIHVYVPPGERRRSSATTKPGTPRLIGAVVGTRNPSVDVDAAAAPF